jgi:transposase
MISPAPVTKVFLACRPIDLRAGFNGLAAKVQQVIERNPFGGSLFIFRGKRGSCVTLCILSVRILAASGSDPLDIACSISVAGRRFPVRLT